MYVYVETKAHSSQWIFPTEPRQKKSSLIESEGSAHSFIWFQQQFTTSSCHQIAETIKCIYLEALLCLCKPAKKYFWVCSETTDGNCTTMSLPCDSALWFFWPKTPFWWQPPQFRHGPLQICPFWRQKNMKGWHFTNMDKTKTESLKELNTISNIVLQKCLEDWKKCWQVIFEGCKINIDEQIKIYQEKLKFCLLTDQMLLYKKAISFLYH